MSRGVPLLGNKLFKCAKFFNPPKVEHTPLFVMQQCRGILSLGASRPTMLFRWAAQRLLSQHEPTMAVTDLFAVLMWAELSCRSTYNCYSPPCSKNHFCFKLVALGVIQLIA